MNKTTETLLARIEKLEATLKLAEEALGNSQQHLDLHLPKWVDVRQKNDKVLAAIRETLAEPKCSDHPDAPHGFDRNASHSADRYVCECEGWEPVAWAYFDADGTFMDALDRQHGAYQTPLYTPPVDAKALLETERKRHAFELSMQEELFADKAEAIRSEALEDAVKFLEENGMIAPNGFTAAGIRGLK